MLDLKHLITLKTIQNANSVNGAANILNLTLSAVSHQIKQVEEHYQCELFERKTNPIKFSPQGRLLLDLAETTIPLFKQAEQQLTLETTQHSRTIDIALECHSCYEWLIPAISDFREYWPDLEIDLITEFNFAPLPKLLSNDLDLVITADPIDNPKINYTKLFEFEMVIGVSNNSPLAQKEFLLPEDIKDHTVIIYPVDLDKLSLFTRFLNPANIRPKNIRTTELTVMIIESTSSGKAISCLPKWAYQEYTYARKIKTLSMGKNPIMQMLYAATRNEDSQQPIYVDFTKLARLNALKRLKEITLS